MPEEEPTEATAGLLLVHTPPGVPSVSGKDVPTQANEVPLMAPAEGERLTVTVVVVVQLPTVYVIIAVPTVTPLTIPVEEPIDAMPALLLDHVPPPLASDNVMVLPVQTTGAAGVMADGEATTVTTFIAAQPNPLV